MHWTTLYQRLEASDRPFVMVTVIEAGGSTPREVGARCFITGDGSLEGTIGGGTVEEEARLEAVAALSKDAPPKPFTKRYVLEEVLGQCCGGTVKLLFETVVPEPRLYVFGAGHIGRALAGILADSRLAVTVIDQRPEFADENRFPPSVRVLTADPLEIIPELVFSSERTFVMVVTHSHCLDQRILEQVLAQPFRYTGLIGSRAKWAKFRRELEAYGIAGDVLDRVQCPAGLPLGDKRPAEVAVSIAAEMLTELPRSSKGLDAKAAAHLSSANKAVS